MRVPFTRKSTITACSAPGCDLARAVWRSARAAGLLIAILGAGCKVTSPHWCFELEYGDCPAGGSGPTQLNEVVGFPDSLLSKDPANQIGILTVGDSVVLRYVRSPISPRTAACASQELVHDSLRWGVSDSSIATVRGSRAGIGILYARQVGRVELRTTSYLSPTWPPQYWAAGMMACPSGTPILGIEIVASRPADEDAPDTIRRIRPAATR